MEAQKISVKLFVEKDSFAPAEFVPVLHRWIQERSLEDHLVVDVADYAHVPAGPGTLLVTHEANIHLDRTNDRLGLLYFRKTQSGTSFADRLRAVLANALKIATKLEQEPEFAGRLRFRTNELELKINDRLLAPNTAATFAAVRGELQKLADDLYGAGKATVVHNADPALVFGVTIKSSSTVSPSDLLSKVAPVAV